MEAIIWVTSRSTSGNTVRVEALTRVLCTSIHRRFRASFRPLTNSANLLSNSGKRALAHGTCPYVGIGGHAGQGGFGIPSRLWGLLADQITSIQIVTADGSIRTASQTKNADLFWAAMGAGANFGIITQFTAATHAAVDSIAFSYSFANYRAKDASRGLLAWQKFANDPKRPLDSALGLQLHVNPGSTPSGISFSVSGSYCEYLYIACDTIPERFRLIASGVDNADIAKLNATMAPLLAELGKPTSVTMQVQDWITSVLYYAGAPNVNGLNTTLAPDVHDHFFATSTFVSERAPLQEPSTDALMQYFYGPATKTKVGWFIILYVSSCCPENGSADAKGIVTCTVDRNQPSGAAVQTSTRLMPGTHSTRSSTMAPSRTVSPTQTGLRSFKG